jgi:acyl dehydratase
VNLARLLSWPFPETRTRYAARDTILYALTVGACTDPLDRRALRLVYEEGLQALPSMACVLAHPGFWFRQPELGMDWVRLVHGEQRFHLRAPLPPEGEVLGRFRVTGVVDKGPGSGALLCFRKTLHGADGTELGSTDSTFLLRGDGGCGSYGEPAPELAAMPAATPHGAVEFATPPSAALYYRLNGDYNPLHADPEVARKAGFPRPILHGLCTYGVACQSLVRGVCGGEAGRLRGMAARFTKPVFPGETLRTEWWLGADGTARFRCLSLERGEVVLDRGSAVLG